MAVFHHLFSILSRGGHSCAMATAAYRSGSKLKLRTSLTNSGEEEIIFDYSSKKGIGFSCIATLDNIPEWVKHREAFWQYVEDSQVQVNGDLACESVFALPEELTLEQNITMVMEFTNKILLPLYSVVDINIHNEHSNNPHVHFMSPIIVSDYLIKQKPKTSRELDVSKAQKQNLQKVEEGFVDIANRHLELNGYNCKISNQPTGVPRYNELRPWL